MSGPTFKVWITKYALTQGIIEAEVRSGASKEMVVIETPESVNQNFHGEGKEWHRTIEGALSKFDDLKEKKIDSHKKAINKLKNQSPKFIKP